MCHSLKLRLNGLPRCPDVPNATRCDGIPGSGFRSEYAATNCGTSIRIDFGAGFPASALICCVISLRPPSRPHAEHGSVGSAHWMTAPAWVRSAWAARFYFRIVPPLGASNELDRFGWAPGAGFVGKNRTLPMKRVVHHGPGRFDTVVANEERGVATHRITEKSLIREFFARRAIPCHQLDPLAAHRLAGLLDPRSLGDHDFGIESESKVVRLRGTDLIKNPPRWLHVHQHLGSRDRQLLAGADIKRHAMPAFV